MLLMARDSPRIYDIVMILTLELAKAENLSHDHEETLGTFLEDDAQ